MHNIPSLCMTRNCCDIFYLFQFLNNNIQNNLFSIIFYNIIFFSKRIRLDFYCITTYFERIVYYNVIIIIDVLLTTTG
jgi:hypothetical protein